MPYSSISGNETRKPVFSSYEHLGSILQTRSRLNNALYICVVRPNNEVSGTGPTGIPGFVDMVEIGDYMDIIVESTPEDIGAIADRISRFTESQVGVVKYEGSPAPGLLQSNAILAVRQAEKNGRGFYIFDGYKDSVRQRLSHLLH